MALYRDPYMRLRALAAGEDPDAPAPEQDVLDTEGIRREQLIAQNQRMSESGRALRQGVQNVKASGVAARGLARSLALDDEAGALEDFRESQRIQQEAAEFGPRVQSVSDVEDVGSALEYARNVGLSQLPNIATAAGGGLAGLGARAAVGGLARRAAGEAVKRAAASKIAAGAGGAAAGTLLQSGAAPGIVLDEQGTGTVRERAGKAAVGAVATGALEALPVVALLRKYGLGNAERALTGSVLGRVSTQAARQGAAEAATEVAQTAGERAAHKWVNDNVELVGPEAYAEYINAAAGGFVGGGIFGAPAGLRGAGRDSEAGKRYQQTLRDWGSKFKRAPTGPKAPKPAPGAAIGATSDPLDMNKVRDDAVRMAGMVATQAKEVGSKIVSKVTQLTNQADDIAKNLLKDTETENSIFEILDAEPYEGTTDANGITVFNAGAGIGPAMDLVRAPRAAQLAREMGVPMRDAIAMSMIDDPVQAATLRKSGAITEAAKAIAGADPETLDNDKITAFQDALGPPNDPRRAAFNRVAATSWETNRDQKQVGLPPTGGSRAEPTKAQQAAGIVEEERPLRTAAGKKHLSKPIPRGTPANSLMFRDAKGARRALTGAQIGRLLIDARKADPELGQLPTEVQLAELVSDYAQQGLQLEPESVRAMQLGQNWAVAPETAARLRAGLAPTPARRATAPTNRPLRGSPEPALNAEYGRGGQVDTQRNEVESMMVDERLGPRRGSPTPTQTIDAPIDTDLAAEERATTPIEKDDFNDLDRLIERTTGEKVGGDFDARKRLYAAALKKAPKGGRVRAELEDAAARYGEAQYQRALKTYQKDRSKTNYTRLVKAREAAERSGTGRVGPARTDLAEPVGARKKVGRSDVRTGKFEATEGSVDHAAASTPEGVRAAIPGVRSRRGLYALKNHIANSTFPDSVKAKLQAQADEELGRLRGTINAAGRADLSANERRNKTAQHFNEVKAKLKPVETLEGALKAVRDLATPAQKRLIDTLAGMRALRGVPFVSTDAWETAPGLVSGVHTGGNTTGKTLESKVALNFSMRDAQGPSIDAIAVVLHEAMHAATAHAEQTNPETRKAVEQLLEHARTYARGLGVDPDTFYGLSETQEFIAEAFINDQLQSLLRQMPARNTNKFASLWDEFKDFVAKLLGFTSEDATALDEIFALGLDLARETAAAREAQFDAIFADTAVENSVFSGAPNGASPRSYVAALSPDNRRYLEALFRRGDVFRQIKAAVPEYRQDELASADRGPQLLVDTGLAMAMTGQLKTTGNAVQELWDAISRTAQVPTKAAYGRALLADLRKRPALTKRALRETDARELTLNKLAQQITRFVNARVRPVVKAFSQDMNARMRSSGVPALTQLATLISQRTGEFRADNSQSLSARQLAARNKYMNQYFALVKGWDDKKKAATLAALQSQAPGDADVERIRAFFGELRGYLEKSGVKMGKTKNYFPVAIDRDAVIKNKREFIALFAAENLQAAMRARDIEMINASKLPQEGKDRKIAALRKMTPEQLAARWYNFASSRQRMSQVGEVTFADGEHDPSFKPQNKRLMDFIYKVGTPEQKAQFAKFQDKNMDRVVVQYLGRATRKAEWTAMDMADQIKSLLKRAKAQGASEDQLQMARDYIDQTMGSYGGDWHPWVKKISDRFGIRLPAFEDFQRFQQGILTYQNLRLLPLALMSSLIDPLGVAVRGGGAVRDSFAGYRDALRAMRDADGNDALRALAEDMGLVERHAVAEALIYLYGASPDVTGLSSRINATLFKYNGLEYVTKFSRLAALSAGQRFLVRHKTNPNKQSERYLRELGLSPADIRVVDGKLVRSEKIEAALARFVDEAVVRPTPQQRPGWHNDPHFALAAQYKGYLYSFFNTVSRRGLLELEQGNPAVLVPLMMYLPVTALGEMMRDMAQGDDEERDASDYAWLSVERSGLLGPHVGLVRGFQADRQYGNSVLNSVSGPTGQQLAQAYDVANGERSATRTAVEALPASALFEDWGLTQ